MKFKNLKPGFKAVYIDFRDYFDWINTIKHEKANPKSLWKKFGLDHNIFYTIYLVVTLPDQDAPLTDYIKRLRVIEILSPINRYLDDLGFAEYLVPEFNQIVDTKTDQLTLSYGIVYRFAFNRFNLGWLISRLLGIVGLILGSILAPWGTIFTWILSLI